ncbi:Uncharacterised protein [uncultured archaeon]|nr:Uncharacterised protein [uncultured archaeon]
MPKMSTLDMVALAVLIIGGLNWGLVGALGLDVVAAIFGAASIIAKVVYIIVGLCALYVAWMAASMKN